MADNQINKEVIISVTTDTTGAASGIDDLKARLKSIGQIDVGGDSIATIKEQLKQAAIEAEKMRTAFGENSKEYTIAANALVNIKSIAQDSIGTIKTQLKEANNQAQLMANLFGANSEEFKRAAQQVADLKDRFGEYNDTIKAFNPDNKLQALVGVAKGAVGAVQGVTGAMTFLGVESKDAAETMAKLQGLMAFSEALNSVDDIKKSFKNFASVLGLTSIATKGQAEATEGATLATKGLGLALKSIGIGLIIAAISYLISNWQSLKTSFTSAFPVLSKLGDYFNSIKVVVMGVGNAVVNFAIAPIKSLIKLIQGDLKGAVAEAKNGFNVINAYKKGSADEANKQRVEETKKIAEEAIKRNENRIKVLKAEGKDTAALEKANFTLRKAVLDKNSNDYKDLIKEQNVFEAGLRKKSHDDQEKLDKAAEQKSKAAAEKAKAEKDKLKADIDSEEKQFQTHLSNLEKLQTDSAKKVAEENASARAKERIENASHYDDEIARVQKETTDALAILKKKHEDEVKLSGGKDVLKLDRDYAEQQQKITKQSNDIISGLNEAKGKNDVAITEKYNDLINNFINAETKTAFDKKRTDIEKQFQEMIDKVKDSDADVTKLIALRDEKLGQVNNEEVATKTSHTSEVNLIKTQRTSTIVDKDTHDETADTPEQRKEKIMALYDAQQQAENDAYELRKVQLAGQHDELEKLEEEHASKLANFHKTKNDSIQSSDDSAFQASQSRLKAYGQLASDLGSLFGKQTVANKALNAANAIMNTWVGVSEIWRAKSVLPEPFGTAAKVASTLVAATSGFAAVKSILATKVQGDSGGGGITAPTAASVTAPVINAASTNNNTTPQDVRVINNPNSVVKAYITDRDLKDNEQKSSFLDKLQTF